MGAADEVEVVLGQELGDNVVAERVRDAPQVVAPAAYLGVGVRPQQVAEEALVGDLASRERAARDPLGHSREGGRARYRPPISHTQAKTFVDAA